MGLIVHPLPSSILSLAWFEVDIEYVPRRCNMLRMDRPCRENCWNSVHISCDGQKV